MIGDHPRLASLYIAPQQLKAERFVVCHRIHASGSEYLPRLTLDLLQARKVREIGIAKRRRIALAALSNQDDNAQGNAAGGEATARKIGSAPGMRL